MDVVHLSPWKKTFQIFVIKRMMDISYKGWGDCLPDPETLVQSGSPGQYVIDHYVHNGNRKEWRSLESSDLMKLGDLGDQILFSKIAYRLSSF